MRLLALICTVIAISSSANAQAPNPFGNLREFVRLNYDQSWNSAVAQASPGNVVIISVPRGYLPKTWEEAITFHYFEQRAPGGMTDLAGQLLVGNTRNCGNIFALPPQSVGSGGYDVVRFRVECQFPRNDPTNIRPRKLNYSHTLLIKGKHHTFMVMRQYETNDFSQLTPAKKQQLDQAALALFRSARICQLEPGLGLGDRKCLPGTEVQVGAAIR